MSNRQTNAATVGGSWLMDVKAGFLVFLIALPLCLGISVASGYPPVAGILTAIIGGIVVSFLGDGRLTIKGPAAGMIVIVLGAVTELGGGDMALGYHRALAVGVAAAVLQMALSMLRVAGWGISISRAVVHGMLAAIGIIIIAKQMPVMLGVIPESKTIFGLLAEIPAEIAHSNPMIAGIGVVSLILLLTWPKLKWKITKAVPAQIIVLAIAIPLALIFDLQHNHPYHFITGDYSVGPNYLVQLPGSLQSGLAFPDFSVIWSATSIKYIIMFALVGMIESTLTVVAMDGIDPEKRISNLNKDLFGLSVGNLVASLIGGLPMISEIVRSKANLDAGANSSRANFAHGVFLLAFVALLPDVIGLIPLAALAAMLIYVGTRLASPAEFRHMKAIGNDQLALFTVTLVTTLATDLLIGVGVGLACKLLLHLSRGASLRDLFRGQVVLELSESEQKPVIKISGAAAFPSVMKVQQAVRELPEGTTAVVIDFNQSPLVDHTFMSGLQTVLNERPTMHAEIIGLDAFRSSSDHPTASRWRRRHG